MWYDYSNVKLLLKIRLSYFFWMFLLVYLILAFSIKGIKFEGGALTLFSVNSFLYGFYLAPILSGQKTRIDDLQKTIRAEANALFSMILKTKKLHDKERDDLQEIYTAYIQACIRQRRPAEGEEEYERLISYCLDYKGENKDTIEKILEGLVSNQQNRSQLSMLLGSKVFSNEWQIILVLLTITLGFALFFDVGNLWAMRPVKAFLCTGLSMLLVNLLKMSTLTHKRAKNLWDPLIKLEKTRFYRID